MVYPGTLRVTDALHNASSPLRMHALPSIPSLNYSIPGNDRTKIAFVRQSWVELRCRRAIFSCVCSVVRATQEQEKFFDALVWSDSLYEPKSASAADKQSVLGLVLDLSKQHAFEVSPPRFQSKRLRPPRPPPMSSASRHKVGKKGARVRFTASLMLSQSSLGFGGDCIAGAGYADASSAGAPVEDLRETYSSQAALAESERREGLSSGKEQEASQGSDLQSQGPSMAPVFGRGARAPGILGGVFGGGKVGEVAEESEEGDDKDDDDSVFLEMSHVNREPCMRSLVLVVQDQRKMFEKRWLDCFEESQGMYEPAWSSGMRVKLADPGLPRNVRLLAFQFALNVPVVAAVKPWANKWIVAMADFLLSPLPEGLRVDGELGLHYLLRDFVHVLLDETNMGWGRAVREGRAEERRCETPVEAGHVRLEQSLLDVGNRLVSHLMSVCSYPPGKTGMLRRNLELISGLIDLFGDSGDLAKPLGKDPGTAGDGVNDQSATGTMGRNDLRLNVRCVADMLGEREGHTGGAHARAESKGAQTKHTILAGLNLLGVLFARKVPVFSSNVSAADDLVRMLPRVCLSYTQKNTFETGTELLAMALEHVSWLKDGGGLPSGEVLCEQLRYDGGEWLAGMVTEQLISMGRGGTKRGAFLHAVATIASSYPRVLTRRLLVTSIEAMQLADASSRGRFLAMLANAFPRGEVPALEVQDLFSRLQPLLPSLLLETEEEFIRGSKQAGAPTDWIPMAQLSALLLVRALVPTMTSSQLGAILGENDTYSLVGLATPSTYPACREVVYDTLLHLYTTAQQYRKEANEGEGTRGGASLTHTQVDTVRCALLQGLSDPDDEGMSFDGNDAEASGDGRGSGVMRRGIRRRLLDIFEGSLSKEIPGERLLYIMRNMFDARTARSWLRFAPYLMLRPTEKAPDYDSLLFKRGLAACEFVDMKVAGEAGTLDVRPMEPVFSFVSLQSQQLEEEGERGYNGGTSSYYGTQSTDVDERKAGMVRATQAYLWSQTQGPGGERWAAGSTPHVGFLSQIPSRMLAGPTGSSASQSAMPPPPPRLPTKGAWRSKGGVRIGFQGQSGEGGVGKRFRESAEGSVSSLAPGESHAMQRRVAAKRQREKASRTKRAVIYRKYRDGELPDIQIKLGDVLRPLQHLSMLDGGIAREVFVQIFKSVYAKLGSGPSFPSHEVSSSGVDGEDDEREASEGMGRRAVALLLQRMLSASKTETGVVACLLAACRAAATAAAGDESEPLSPENASGRRGKSGRREIGGEGGSSQRRRGRLMTPSSNSTTEYLRGNEGAGEASSAGTEGKATGPDGGVIVLNPKLVADAAMASFNFHGGILLLEEAIVRTCREVAAASRSAVASSSSSSRSGKRRSRNSVGRADPMRNLGLGEEGCGAIVEKQQDAWLQLSRLYAALGEKDVLVGVSARASRVEGTR